MHKVIIMSVLAAFLATSAQAQNTQDQTYLDFQVETAVRIRIPSAPVYPEKLQKQKIDGDVLVLLDRVDYRRQRDVLDIAGDLFAETSFLISPTIYGESLFREHVAQRRPLANEIQREGIRP